MICSKIVLWFLARLIQIIRWGIFYHLIPLKKSWNIYSIIYINILNIFLAHLAQRARWAIAITWRPSSASYVVKLFKKSSPLKLPDQFKPNLVWIITRVSSFKIVSGDAVHQPTWPVLLKIEHMVKLQVFE